MKTFLFILSLLAISATNAFAQNKQAHTFEIKNGDFVYDGKPIKIHSGEMHYARIPKPYWRQRLQMVKAMGMNAVATYVFWNYHHPSPDVWDFTSGNKDLRDYIKLAQEEGLFVILRPGPYVCAEWEFGGYPWWLQKNPDLQIRTLNQPFLDRCKNYFSHLASQVKDLQITSGGPIIMVQAENEFGSYVAQRKDIPLEVHKKYNAALIGILKEVGFNVPFFTSDGTWLFEGGAVEGILPTGNGENNITNLKNKVNAYHGGTGPYMVAEFYPGWLDHWAEPFQKVGTEGLVKQTQKFLDSGINFNFYMIHGGTNFGFTSGANYTKGHDIQPDITSYDYDAPISEAGWATDKYKALRAVMQKNVSYKIPEIPAPIPVIAIPAIKLNKTIDVLSWKNSITPEVSDTPLSFEDLNQGHGYVLYSRKFVQPISGKLKIDGLRDFATVYVNGEKVGFLNRQNNKFELEIDIPFNATLDILVENMGRINYGAEIIHNRKGIISPVIIEGNEITGSWEMYRLPFDKAPDLTNMKNENTPGRPTIYEGTFNLTETGDTFLDMAAWGKGIVFVNGHNLGRYWKVGPQQTLYLPGCWLKKGKNKILIFEQLNDKIHDDLHSVKVPVLDKLTL